MIVKVNKAVFTHLPLWWLIKIQAHDQAFSQFEVAKLLFRIGMLYRVSNLSEKTIIFSMKGFTFIGKGYIINTRRTNRGYCLVEVFQQYLMEICTASTENLLYFLLALGTLVKDWAKQLRFMFRSLVLRNTVSSKFFVKVHLNTGVTRKTYTDVNWVCIPCPVRLWW